MASVLTWYKDNSMAVTATVTGSGSSATVTATLLDSAGTTVWTDSLTASGTDDEYTATIAPADALVTTGYSYTLRIAATSSGLALEFEEPVTVEDRRGG